MSVLLFLRYFMLIFLPVAAVSQDAGLVYIQSESKLPFYVKLNGQVYNSSSTGYLSIGGLSSGRIQLGVGFSSDSWSYHEFSIEHKGRDEGYLLKDAAGGWQLLNLQNGGIFSSAGMTSAPPVYTDDAFTNILADIVGTPSLKEKKPDSTVRKEEPVVSDRSVPVRQNRDQAVFASCVQPASHEDFMQLRKKMSREEKEDAMLRMAGRFLPAKCYTAEQIRYLAALFTDEPARFRFVEMAYPYVFDPAHYGMLQTLFTEAEQSERFRLMTEKNEW